MKLLIVTQVVDKNHAILGFFHRWLEEFAQNCDQVEVICLQKGHFDLPTNVTVHSLGKEEQAASSMAYAWRLLKLSWQRRSYYDRVLVHMNPEYVLAGYPAWLITQKPISLWYTHGSVRLPLRIAALVVRYIFTAAQAGMNLRSKKIIITGHGIDNAPEADETKRDLDLVTVGRIAPSKNLRALIDVLVAVRAEKPTTQLTVIGAAVSESEQAHQQELMAYSEKQGVADAITWTGGVPHAEIPKWLMRARVFVHTAQNGSLDKVLLEALASGTPVVTSAPGAEALPLDEWWCKTSSDCTAQILPLLEEYPVAKMNRLQTYVADEHSLARLITTLCAHLK